MMMKKVLCLTCIVMIAAGCGPAPEPTLSAEDIQNTALPLAMTSVAQTQAAIPTATPIPPTATLTFTPAPTSTPFVAISLATATQTALDPCNLPPPSEPQGELVSVKFVNKSGGQVNMSWGMAQPNSRGECGTYSFSFSDGGVATVQVMAGCYWGYAWVSGNKPSTAQTISNICLTDPGTTLGISIGTEVIGPD